VVSGNEASYAGVLPDTDLNLFTVAGGVKEQIVLHSAAAANSWTFPLNLTGLTASQNSDGAIVFTDAAGVVQASVPAGFMQDSNIDPVSGERPTSNAVTYQLVTANGAPALQVSVDAAWLRDPARVFPVTVDPTVYSGAYGSTSSTYVETVDNTGNNASQGFLKIGTYDGGTHKANTFIGFSGFETVGSLTYGHWKILSADLMLYDAWAGSCTATPLYVSPVTASWSAGTLAGYPGVSYGAQIGSATPSVPHACANSSMSPTGGDWVDVPLDPTTLSSWSSGCR
jgi:hypothetical protein